jgi:predicted TIM-barrel fold metal-dependent hydrolase
MYRKDGPQEMQPVGETEFVQGIAAQSASGQCGITNIAAGIVGSADFTLGAAVAPVLEAHIAASSDRFRGIRTRSSRKLLSDPKFREGFACLQRYNLSFDVIVSPQYLMELVDLARAFPEIPIIVNHTGDCRDSGLYITKREEVFQWWKKGIAALANCPNVVMKLGGLGMPAYGFGWNERATPPNSTELAEAMAPYYHLCIEQFGANRCMFESNFPVDKVSYSYTVMWNSFKRISEDFSPEERAALFHDTAVCVYRLGSNDKG